MAGSVLASLTAAVMEEKKAATKPKLTPVEGEMFVPVKAALPNDTGEFMSNEVLREHAVQLRHLLAYGYYSIGIWA